MLLPRAYVFVILGRSFIKIIRKADRKHIFLSFTVVCDININIVSGLRYLHSIGLVHRDIKPENILLCSQDGNEHFAKIADFGLSFFCRDENSNTPSVKTLRSYKRVGTIQYMAPEILKADCYRYSNKTVIFSEGMILWESVTYETPYTDDGFPRDKFLYRRAVENHVTNGGRGKISENLASKAWWGLTQRCWAQKAEDRPGAEEVLKELIEVRKAYLNSNGNSSSSESSSSRGIEIQIELYLMRNRGGRW